MQSNEFDTAMERCIFEINDLPDSQRNQLMQLVEETRQRQQSIDRSVRAALEALDDWRICQRYMIFDMEARQRELAQAASDDEKSDGEVDPSEWL